MKALYVHLIEIEDLRRQGDRTTRPWKKKIVQIAAIKVHEVRKKEHTSRWCIDLVEASTLSPAAHRKVLQARPKIEKKGSETRRQEGKKRN